MSAFVGDPESGLNLRRAPWELPSFEKDAAACAGLCMLRGKEAGLRLVNRGTGHSTNGQLWVVFYSIPSAYSTHNHKRLAPKTERAASVSFNLTYPEKTRDTPFSNGIIVLMLLYKF